MDHIKASLGQLQYRMFGEICESCSGITKTTKSRLQNVDLRTQGYSAVQRFIVCIYGRINDL
ncbi:MAG: hypothetical protein LBC42_02605 [Puniceicoccales bacterium]|nr:hypothetical protein [Puniceicoccales bacterium]